MFKLLFLEILFFASYLHKFCKKFLINNKKKFKELGQTLVHCKVQIECDFSDVVVIKFLLF